MQVGLHRFHADSVAAAGCRRGRVYALARELCEHENWHNEKGDLCLASARRALPRSSDSLCRRCGSVRRGERRHGISLTLRCGLAEVGEVALESESDDKKQWRDGDASSAGVSAGGAAQLSCRPFMVGWAASVSAPPVGKRATSLLAGRTGRQPPWSTITGFSCCRGCVCTDLRRAFSTLRRRD